MHLYHNDIRTTAEFDLEEALNVFSWSIVLHSGVCVLPHHVIDGPHDVHHLLECDGQNGENVIEDVKKAWPWPACQKYGSPGVLNTRFFVHLVVVLF